MDAASYFLKLSNQRSLFLSGKFDIGKIDLLSCSDDNKLVCFSLRGYYNIFSTYEEKILKTWQDTPSTKIYISSKNFVVYKTLSNQVKIIDFDKSKPEIIASDIYLADFNDKFIVGLSSQDKISIFSLEKKDTILDIPLPKNFVLEEIVLKNDILLTGKLEDHYSFMIYSIHSNSLSLPKILPTNSYLIGSSDDLEYIALRSENLGLSIINTVDPSKSCSLPLVDSKPKSAFFSKDKTLLVIEDFDEYISFWWTNKELNANNEPIFKQKICGQLVNLTFSNNGNLSSLITYKNGFLKIWLPASKIDRLNISISFKSDERDSFSHNGYFLSSASFTEKNEAVCLFVKPRWESKLVKFDLYNKMNITYENTLKESLIIFSTLSFNSKLLATLKDKNKIKIINTQSNSTIQEFAIKDDQVNTFTFSPDLRYLVIGSNTLKLWSIDKQSFVKSVSPELTVDRVAVSPNSELIAFTQRINDNLILKIIDIDSKEIKRKLEGLNHINSLLFSPNSKFLFVGSTKKDPTIRAYSIDSGNLVFSYQTDFIDINDMCISSNGTHLFFGGSDEKIYVLDLRKNKIVKILNGHYDIIRKIYISEDDKFLISSSDDERLCVWMVVDYIYS
ncbi:WD40 repeat-containing protein [Thermodesulfobium narugense DSM 14796]|uniref:WD40 repeat-containing protein n=1 Tax=Thermodesulfobium narugense DSM 14796 TaxID=747365 RepID=M1E6E9_9BACT|nr:WD40 repeat domain-containing protein [Thermodesulfobium narugense]AEE13970.1 WD40 repeat-containing protein [Thermodesulfobium narugense DSM 14796]